MQGIYNNTFKDLGIRCIDEPVLFFMQKIMKNTQYIQIQGWMLNILKLKGNDLIIYSIIYGFSQDGESKFTGSLNYLGDATNTSRPTVIKALKYLVSKELIIKEFVIKNKIKYNTYRVDYFKVNFLNNLCKETLHPPCKEPLPNNIPLNTIEDRMANFSSELKPYLEKYGKVMLNEFYSYWTEASKNKKKLRFEGERFFDLKRRLSTWHGRNNNSNNSETPTEFNADNYTD